MVDTLIRECVCLQEGGYGHKKMPYHLTEGGILSYMQLVHLQETVYYLKRVGYAYNKVVSCDL